jgi:hypothetical protein
MYVFKDIDLRICFILFFPVACMCPTPQVFFGSELQWKPNFQCCINFKELERRDCAALRNNLVVMMADFCVRYTALVDW